LKKFQSSSSLSAMATATVSRMIAVKNFIFSRRWQLWDIVYFTLNLDFEELRDTRANWLLP
jgi:hypothetical protein